MPAASDSSTSPAPPASRWTARAVSARLPQFPWDRLAPHARTARAHPEGIVDLSVGSPVDPTPEIVRRALETSSDSPGYPTTYGTPALRDAAAGYLRRRFGALVDAAGVVPTVGSKELVAWLPTLLGIGPGDVVAYPQVAYPTYEVGALLAGAQPAASDGLTGLGPAPVRLVWLNTPSNPTGRVLPAEHLRKVVQWARERGAVVVSDECYAEFCWDVEPVSVLNADVCEGSSEGLLAVHSLSKRSNMAGYRAGFVAGDPAVVAELLEVRRHAGMMVPAPVQAAMVAALGDDEHVARQRERYQGRRALLRPALQSAGFRIDHSEAGIYLWATKHEGCWDTVAELAESGVLVAPGEFYGPAGAQHVRLAFTATDERVEAAARRLTR